MKGSDTVKVTAVTAMRTEQKGHVLRHHLGGILLLRRHFIQRLTRTSFCLPVLRAGERGRAHCAVRLRCALDNHSSSLAYFHFNIVFAEIRIY